MLTALVALASALTIWVKEQVLETNEWVEASTELLQNEEIRDALAISLVNTLFVQDEVQAALEDELPAEFGPLAAPIAGALREVAVPAAQTLLASPEVQELWEELNLRMHTRLVAVLEGSEDELLVTEGGDVVLDLGPLAEELGARLGIEVALQPGEGEILILRSDELEAAQTAVQVLKTLSVFMGFAILGLLALALYLARGFRREALRAAAAALLLVGVVLLVVRRVAGDAIVEALTSTATEPAGAATWLIATDLLGGIATAVITYGAVGLVGAWLAGPTRPAVSLRRTVAPTFRERPAVIFGAVFLVFLIVLLFGPEETAGDLGAVAVFGVLLALGVEMLRRQIAAEFPSVPPTGSTAPPG